MRPRPAAPIRSAAAWFVAWLAAQLWLTAVAGAGDAGWVAGVNGAPTVTRGTTTVPLKRGDAVAVGDRIDTAAGAKVKVLLADDSVLAIGPNSQVVLDELTLSTAGRSGRLRVLLGRFKLAIAAWLEGPSDYEVRTPTAVAGVRGTVLWGDTQLDTICALHGHVQVRALRGGAVTELDAGHCATRMASGETVPMTPTAEEVRRFLREVSLD